MIKKISRKLYRYLIRGMGRYGLGLGGSLGSLKSIRNLQRYISNKIKPEFVMLRGNKIYLDKEDQLRLSYLGDKRELDETIMYKQYIKEGDVVVDVGSFIGDNTLDFANYVGKEGKVYAFEIGEDNYNLLEKNVKANNYENVIISDKAVSDKTGITKCYADPLSETGHRIHNTDVLDNPIEWKEKEIKCITLDDTIKGKVDFLKIDCEGAEPLVIKGAERIIKENENLKIMIETSIPTISKFGISPKDYFKRFINLGFEIYIAEGFIENKERIKDIDKFLKEHEFDTLNLFMIKK